MPPLSPLWQLLEGTDSGDNFNVWPFTQHYSLSQNRGTLFLKAQLIVSVHCLDHIGVIIGFSGTIFSGVKWE